MADELSFDAFLGAGGEKPEGSSTRQESTSTSPIPFKSFVTGQPEVADSGMDFGSMDEERKTTLQKTLTGLKQVGGEAAAIADFVLSMPGFLLATGAQLGGTIQAAARGVPLGPTPGQLNPVTAFTVGREAGKEVSEHLTNPVQKLMNLFGDTEAYDKALTTRGMSKFAELVEEAGLWTETVTGGKASRDAIPMLVDTLMAGMTGVGSGRPKSVMTAAQKTHFDQLRAQARRGLEQEAKDAAPRELTPTEFVTRLPVQDQINQTLGIKSEAERASYIKQRQRDVKEAFRSPAEGSDYGSVGESQFKADERLSNEAAWRQYQNELMAAENEAHSVEVPLPEQPERIGQAEILRIMQKPGYERTAEDLITLREARKQGGNTSMDALHLLGAAGIGAAVGGALSDDQLRGAILGGTAMGASAALMHGPGKVPSRFGQGGAVKGPGGMWHPEAVERLRNAIAPAPNEARRAAVERADAEGRGREVAARVRANATETPLHTWSDKAIRNYLNKYAGTERDPLKDVEIPFGGEGGGEIIKWGEAFDKAILEKPANFIRDVEGGPDWLRGAKDTEKIFGMRGPQGGQYPSSIKGYLSHVGDYLRQNVKPEELPRYDLVRAVRETAENDKRVAKQMEKAAADATKTLPVYKEYPDGFKWVELKLPEKLTEEQKKQVAPAMRADILDTTRQRYGAGVMPDKEGKYVALGTDGLPLQNSYTGEPAVGPTPERAWLAGRLAEEGNQMGHCVGGYCEGVASGDSRIYSLRDSKGKSHVTIEVDPNNSRMLSGERLNKLTGDPQAFDKYKASKYFRSDHEGGIHKFLEDVYPKAHEKFITPSISQIKGKQNRAPNKEYLPYVQDFVKGGKWGEVGDLQNTGLVDVKDRYKSENFHERESSVFSSFMQEKFGDARFITPDERAAAVREYDQKFDALGRARPGYPRQQGFIDQKLVVGLGTIGLGGLIGGMFGEDRALNALLGALAGSTLHIPGAAARLKQVAQGADYMLGAISTRIGNISPALRHRAREYEMRVLTESHTELHKVAPWMAELERLPENQKAELSRAILTNDKERIAYLMKGNVPLVDGWRNVRNVLHELGEKLQGHGRFKTMLDDYFPRLVKDVEGLKEALGAPERTKLEQALASAEADAARVRGTPLSQVEISSIINREVQGFRRAKGYQPGFAKQRSVEDITEKLQPFYHTPAESLFAYVRGAVQDLEMARFFGKDLAQTKIGSQNHVDVQTSIGNVVGRELKEGKITAKQAQELISMMQSRFQGGERASSGLVQEVRNAGNIGLLGNIVSAVTQFGDAATAIYTQGLRAATTSMLRNLSGRERITTADFGLADHVAEEFVSRTKTADWLNKIFKYSGFTAVDRFGKNVNLDAALTRAERLSQTPNGVKELGKKYEAAYGDEFPQLVSDLRNGDITPRVRAMLFSELSDIQPISKLEMPQMYLDNPNGRLMYMLKTFMLKQMDLVRRDVWNEAKRGNIPKAALNATEYALVLGISGAATTAVQDWLLGRQVKFEAGDVLENVLKTFGWGEYVRDKAKKGRVLDAIAGAIAPPYKMMDDLISRDPRAVQYIPIIGKLFYSWELGGRERNELARAQKDKAAGKDVELSDRAKDYRQEQRDKAKAKKEAR